MVNLKIDPSIYSAGSPVPPRVLQPVCISSRLTQMQIYLYTPIHTWWAEPLPWGWHHGPSGCQGAWQQFGAFSLPASCEMPSSWVGGLMPLLPFQTPAPSWNSIKLNLNYMGPQDKVTIFSYTFKKKGKEVCLGTVSCEIVCPALSTVLFVICMPIFSLIL